MVLTVHLVQEIQAGAPGKSNSSFVNYIDKN